jgi:hypothetical protein
MKSQLFKTAWAIFKMQTVTFSEALTQAWKETKKGLKAVIVRMNKTVKSERWIGFETIYYNALQVISIETKRTVCNNDGASAWYDGKTLNLD